MGEDIKGFFDEPSLRQPVEVRAKRRFPASLWGGMCCESERDKRAIRSWFGQFIPDDWGDPLKADVLENNDTGEMTKLRAMFRREDGVLMEAIRSTNRRGFMIRTRPAGADIRRGYAARQALLASASQAGRKDGSSLQKGQPNG